MRIADTNHSKLPQPHFLPRLPEVELQICRGIAKLLLRKVASPVFLIGSASDCDLVLGDSQFPDVHSYLFLTEHGVFLRYLEQGPDVTVNGEAVRSQQLFNDSRIRMGPYEFRVKIQPNDDPTDDDPTDDEQDPKKRRDPAVSRLNEAPTSPLIDDIKAYLHEPSHDLRKSA